MVELELETVFEEKFGVCNYAHKINRYWLIDIFPGIVESIGVTYSLRFTMTI